LALDIACISHAMARASSCCCAVVLDQLALAGYLVAPRDPAVRPGHAGAFMIKDQQESDGYCIVGDDINALISEAHGHLT
jgi:hypothetical protein